MPKKKPKTSRVIVTDAELARQIASNDYGDVCCGEIVGGVALAEPASVPAARRRREEAQEMQPLAASDGNG